MGETYIENIKKIQDSIKPVQAIADSLTPVQTAVNNINSSQLIEYHIDLNSVHTAASNITENAERANEAIAEQNEYINVCYEFVTENDTAYDLAKIENAIKKANEAVIAAEHCEFKIETIRTEFNLSNVLSAVYQTIEAFSGINRVYKDLYETYFKAHKLLHNLFHWLIAQFGNYLEKRKEKKTHYILLESKRVLSLCPNPCIKALIIDFHEHTIPLRKCYLLRHQNRGDDSSDNYCFI